MRRYGIWICCLLMLLASSAFSHGTPPGKWRTVSGYLVNKTADSTAIETQNGDTLWFTNAGLYWTTGAVLDSALLDSVANGKGRFSGSGGGGTSDSTGIDTNGDGTVDAYLYSTVAGAAHIKKGTNITLTVAGDTVTIAAAGGGGTTDSTRLGNGLAVRTSAADSIAAPTDTLEADTSVMATLGHAENYADSAAGDSARAAAADSIALALRLAGGTMTGDIVMTNVDIRNADSLETKVVMLNDGTDSSYITPTGRTYPSSVVRWVLGLPAFVEDSITGSPISVGNTTSVIYTFPTTIGTAGQVIKAPASGTLLEWGAGGGGTGWNWADSAGEPPFWVDSSNHADSANHADAADSSGKALGDAAGNTITSTYETITNVGKIGDDTTNFKTAFGWGDHSAQTYLTEAAGGNPVGDADVPDGITINGLGDSTNWNTGYVIANGLDTLARINFSRNFFDTSANGDTLIIKTQSIGVNQLASNAVTSAKIQDGTVASVDIADGTVTGTDIASNTVAGSNILNSTISSLKILDSTLEGVDFSTAAWLKIEDTAQNAAGDTAAILRAEMDDSARAAPIIGRTLTGGKIWQGDYTGAADTAIEAVITNGAGMNVVQGPGTITINVDSTTTMATKNFVRDSTTGPTVETGEITNGTISTADIDTSNLESQWLDSNFFHLIDFDGNSIDTTSAGKLKVADGYNADIDQINGDLSITGKLDRSNFLFRIDTTQIWVTNGDTLNTQLFTHTGIGADSATLHPDILEYPKGFGGSDSIFGWTHLLCVSGDASINKNENPAVLVSNNETWWGEMIVNIDSVVQYDSTTAAGDTIKLTRRGGLAGDTIWVHEDRIQGWRSYDPIGTRYFAVHGDTAHNPIFDTSSHPGISYNSDPDFLLTYGDTLALIDRQIYPGTGGYDTVKILMLFFDESTAKWIDTNSVGDTTWIITEISEVNTVISPSFEKVGNRYHIYALWNTNNNYSATAPESTTANVVVRYSSDNWQSGWTMDAARDTLLDTTRSSPVVTKSVPHVYWPPTIEGNGATATDLWHLNITALSASELLAPLVICDRGTNGSNAKLHLSYSHDGGASWETQKQELLTSSASGWDDSYLYRAAFSARETHGGLALNMYYTGYGTGGVKWNTGRTTIYLGNLDTVDNSLGEFVRNAIEDSIKQFHDSLENGIVVPFVFVHGHDFIAAGDSVVFGLEAFSDTGVNADVFIAHDTSMAADQVDTFFLSIPAMPNNVNYIDSVYAIVKTSNPGAAVASITTFRVYGPDHTAGSLVADSLYASNTNEVSTSGWFEKGIQVNKTIYGREPLEMMFITSCDAGHGAWVARAYAVCSKQ